MNVSVVLTTYKGDDVGHLRECLDSVLNQDHLPAEIVVVIDGPGCDAHLSLLTACRDNGTVPFVIVPLETNLGVSAARNAGVSAATNDLIAFMDADDLMMPQRLARQVEAMTRMADVDVLGTWLNEFVDTPDNVASVKAAPTGHDDLVRSLRWCCLVSQPSLMVRKDALLRVGGYRTDLFMAEDWDLLLRLVQNGSRLAVLPTCLISVRTSREQMRRRGGLSRLLLQYKVHWWWWRRGLINVGHMLMLDALYTPFRLVPPDLRRMTYRLVRRPAPSVALGANRAGAVANPAVTEPMPVAHQVGADRDARADARLSGARNVRSKVAEPVSD